MIEKSRINRKGVEEWYPMNSSTMSEPYTFDTFEEAERFIQWIYPYEFYEYDIRIKEIK